MFCSLCGKQIEDGNRFCTGCGAPIQSSPVIQPQIIQQQMVQTRVPQPSPALRAKPKKKKKLRYIVIVVLVLVFAAAAAFFGYRFYQKSYANDQIELGQSYLLDQNYKEAIVAFTNALKCDPKNVETYECLVDAYIEWADYVVETKQDYAEAIDILVRGQEQTGDDRIEEKIQEYAKYMEMQENLTDILDRIAALCNDGNFDDVFTYMQSEEYAYLIENVKQLRNDFITETAYGRMGIYRVKSNKYGNYMLYYGDFGHKKDSYIRAGVGVWLGYYDGNNCLATGEWENDKPNGVQTMREWNSGLAENVTYRVVQGDVKDGLWDGPVKWSFEWDSGEKDVYDVTFKNGVAEILNISERDGNRYVIGKNVDESEGELSIDEPDEVFSITGF